MIELNPGVVLQGPRPPYRALQHTSASPRNDLRSGAEAYVSWIPTTGCSPGTTDCRCLERVISLVRALPNFGRTALSSRPVSLGPPNRASAPSPKSRVLVIDDDDVSRELQCSVLRAAGHQIIDLPTPIGATRLIQDNEIEAVVVDIMMPALSGDRLAKLLRNNPRFRGLGVVLVTGDANVDLAGLAREVSADAVVHKGAIREQITHAVEAAIKARRRDARYPR
jgi:CheY-like chemotaxis protein